jgi:hypothetical protein
LWSCLFFVPQGKRRVRGDRSLKLGSRVALGRNTTGKRVNGRVMGPASSAVDWASASVAGDVLAAA